MKVFVLLAALVAVATAEDLICKMGELACKINCMASGHMHGHCDDNGECECNDPKPDVRTELVCMLGGELACEINCFTSTGHFAGKCTEENDCICDHPDITTESSLRLRRAAPERGDLACRHGGDDVCAAFCHWTTGEQKGHCDKDDKCICG